VQTAATIAEREGAFIGAGSRGLPK